MNYRCSPALDLTLQIKRISALMSSVFLVSGMAGQLAEGGSLNTKYVGPSLLVSSAAAIY